MAKLNTRSTGRRPSPGPMQVGQTPDTKTFEGAVAYTPDVKTSVFLTATTGYINEDAYYEKGDERVARFVQEVRAVAPGDPEWFVEFVTWLRTGGNIRTASVVAAAQGAHMLLQAGKPKYIGLLLLGALQRADEPGEFVAYWRDNISRNIPRPVKRALSQVVAKLYNQYSLLKYDTPRAGYRFGDVIEQVHPDPALATEERTGDQAALYKFALDRRRYPTEEPPFGLPMIREAWAINRLPAEEKRQLLLTDEGRARLRAAGMTWEDVSGFGVMDADAWKAAIPLMGYMARLRNLRNFEEQGLDDQTLQEVANYLADPDRVAKSRQLPYRFLSAWLHTQHTIWKTALGKALQHSLVNIPELPGKTVVLVDTSGSMDSPMSGKSGIKRTAAGALFGVALAAKNQGAVLYGFANGTNVFYHRVIRGSDVLHETERFVARNGEDGHGTEIARSLAYAYSQNKDAARFVIVSDEQTFGGWMGGDVEHQVPPNIPVYAFNLAGYNRSMMPTSGTRHQLGGLTDATFGLIRSIEAGQQGRWPWETGETLAEVDDAS